MGNRKKRDPGPQGHAEGQHGAKTHRRFIEQLHESQKQQDAGNAEAVDAPREGDAR